MKLKYYIKNSLFGFYCAFLYIFYQKNDVILTDHIAQLLIINAFLCPYSKFAIEHITFKLIKKDFFTKCKLNEAPVAKVNLLMLYDLLCLTLAIPFGLLGVILLMKKRN
ncbi:colicin transporter [Salmonella enterica]|nr:colicin transporter [Salmonella enterica]EHJ8972775.1 colicin transporter [Salmonella enterica]